VKRNHEISFGTSKMSAIKNWSQFFGPRLYIYLAIKPPIFSWHTQKLRGRIA